MSYTIGANGGMRVNTMNDVVAMTTDEAIRSLLTENTGAHFLDSGGAYGRNWERNQSRDFDAEPESVVDFSNGWIDATHNLYHWLRDRCSYEPEMQELFEQFRKDLKEPDLTVAQDFPYWLRERGNDVNGLYGEGSPMVVNTYNGEDMLSQVIQYVYFECDGVPYIALSVHGGCDVRGGYTSVKLFSVDESILFNADATIFCEGKCHDVPGQMMLDGTEIDRPTVHFWHTDDANNWYDEGSTQGMNLEDYNWRKIENLDEWEQDTLCVLPDGTGLCPKCGAKLGIAY